MMKIGFGLGLKFVEMVLFFFGIFNYPKCWFNFYWNFK